MRHRVDPSVGGENRRDHARSERIARAVRVDNVDRHRIDPHDFAVGRDANRAVGAEGAHSGECPRGHTAAQELDRIGHGIAVHQDDVCGRDKRLVEAAGAVVVVNVHPHGQRRRTNVGQELETERDEVKSDEARLRERRRHPFPSVAVGSIVGAASR